MCAFSHKVALLRLFTHRYVLVFCQKCSKLYLIVVISFKNARISNFIVVIIEVMDYNIGISTARSQNIPFMIHIVLLEPEIPENTGNIGRTCVATGSTLHLIHPLGFETTEKRVKRSGLDYWPDLTVIEYSDITDFFSRNPLAKDNLWLATTKAPQSYQEAAYEQECYLFFGKESAGLPEDFRLANYNRCVRLPMHPKYRSLNLSNAVAVFTYEVLRQQGFPGLKGTGEMAE